MFQMFQVIQQYLIKYFFIITYYLGGGEIFWPEAFDVVSYKRSYHKKKKPGYNGMMAQIADPPLPLQIMSLLIVLISNGST